jgi:hypothetical protein
MKNLIDICNESILNNIDASIQKGDNIFKQAEVELNSIKNMTWEDVLNTANFSYDGIEFSFIITCPNLLLILGIDNPKADGLIIYITLNSNYDTHAVLTIKGKNQKNYKKSVIVGEWTTITNYIGVIRPKKLAVVIKRIQDAFSKIADIDTLKNICSKFKKD